MAEAAARLTVISEKSKPQGDLFYSNQGGVPMNSNLNDDIFKYLNRFCKYHNVDEVKEGRNRFYKQLIAQKKGTPHGVLETICIKLEDFGCTDYEEAISLFPDLKGYEKKTIEDYIIHINASSN